LEDQRTQQVEAKEKVTMFIDRMKLAKKDDLRNGQLIFWKPGCYTEDVGVVLDNDWELECTIFWFREPETAGQPDHFCSRWFDDEEGNVFVLRGNDDQNR
jgi:hypothetical protein